MSKNPSSMEGDLKLLKEKKTAHTRTADFPVGMMPTARPREATGTTPAGPCCLSSSERGGCRRFPGTLLRSPYKKEWSILVSILGPRVCAN